MKKIIIIFLTGMIIASFSFVERNILLKEAMEIGFDKELITDFSEIDFPGYSDRDFWNNLPQKLKEQYIVEAEELLSFDWPVVKATDYLEIIRSGDRRQSVYAAPRSALVSLVMGELVEGEGRFIDQIINGVWYYCEQTWWGWSAHLSMQKARHGLPDVTEPFIDLGVGEITNILSWTYFLFKDEFDKVHPLIAPRLKNEIMHKAVNPYYERDDLWWMGFGGKRSVNNWNPWTNHNMLTAIMILEDDKDKKIEGVNKVLRSLDVFINGYTEDGGCDEGPSYWGRAGASLYQNLDLLKRATKGRFDVFDNQLIKRMGNYIYKVFIDYPYFINFADADASTGSRPGIIYRYGEDINDPVMRKFGAFLAKKQGWGEKIPSGKVDEQIMQLMYLDKIEGDLAENPLIPDFWLPDTEVAGARDKAGSSTGFFFAAKGGHNAESHNHNDIGSFILYYNGKPCFVDVGREKYVAKTFSPHRYEIWTMQSQFHNLPKINGQDQMQGREYVAKNTIYYADEKKAMFSTDIVGAYMTKASVNKWIRSYKLEKDKQFIIRDNYELSEVRDGLTTLNFITCCKVSKLVPGVLLIQGEEFKLNMKYNDKKVTPGIEFIEVTDSILRGYWPGGLTRIVFTFNNIRKKGLNEIVITKP